MKGQRVRCFFVSLLLLVLTMRAAGEAPGSDHPLWQRVRQAIHEGLPRTAIEQLEPVIKDALDREAYAEAIRAISQRVALEGTIQGNKPEEKIALLRDEIDAAPAAMQPVMQAIMANWHWHYFQRNRWRFMQRTATATTPGDDITTWDLPRLFAEIDRWFTAALAAADDLRQTPIADYDALLEKGAMPDRYRPTLYDFVAAEALKFYTSGEQAAALPQDAFSLAADSPVFDSIDHFIDWDVTTSDTNSPIYKATRLYQQILGFHRDSQHMDAFADWDLGRLRFGFNHATGESKEIRYQTALRQFIDDWGNHAVSARARHDLAERLQNDGDLVAAHALATEGWQEFPESAGGKLCYNLMRAIEERSLTIATERVWNEPWPAIRVTYRNLEQIHFRLVAQNFETALAERPRNPEHLDDAGRRAVMRATPALQWTAAIPPTDDYHERTEQLEVPDNLEPGWYFLLASEKPEFGEIDNIVSYASVWVSDLALIIRDNQDATTLEGFVLDAASGEPVADAGIRIWTIPRRNEDLEELPGLITDAHGSYHAETQMGSSYAVLAQYGNHQLAAFGWQRRLRPSERSFSRTVIFTDRAIYRPGQTIHYKGIYIRVNQTDDDYEVMAGQPVSIRFRDVNGRDIETRQHKSNDYGSFSGSFTAPHDRLMGRMRIEGIRGATTVTVEEYKRPTFVVRLDPPATAPRLNDAVHLTGTATAYTGAPTDGAQVRWRVVRAVRYPPWWPRFLGWIPSPREQSQEIAHGTTTTDPGGDFVIEFTARADPGVSRQSAAFFEYTIHADVTDGAGETRSAQRAVRVGYTALQAALSAPEWLTADSAFDIAVRTTTLDDIPQAVEGSLKIHRLQQPDTVHRRPLAARPDRFHLDPFGSSRHPGTRPNGNQDSDAEPDWSDPGTWPLGPAVFERPIRTDADGHATPAFKLPAGVYRAVLQTSDRFGNTVRAELPLHILDPAEQRLTVNMPHLFSAPTWTAEPGDRFTALWGSGYDTARAFVEIEHRGNLLQSYWTDPSRTQQIITQDVTEAMRGGFTVHVTMVRENRAYLESRRINVPWRNKQLNIRWERFTSKLEPGQKEVWTAIVSGTDAQPAAAEMVAALYDQSLDAFLPHAWQDSFGIFRQDHSLLRSTFANTHAPLRRLTGQRRVDRQSDDISYREFPHDVFGDSRGYRMRRSRHAFQLSTGMTAADTDDAVLACAEAAPQPGEPFGGQPDGADATPADPTPDLDQVSARAILDETAFFFPHLTANDDGEVRIAFTMPEALTQWRFLGFAHDRELRAGLLTDSVITAKDLMVQPNPPRFLREGDRLVFTVRVSNRSESRQQGSVRLSFTDARTGDTVNDKLNNTQTDQTFDVPAKESRTYAWQIDVPDTAGILVYRAVGSSGTLSDGEEGYLPVLSRRIMVTESMPLPIRGPAEKRFAFDKLLQSDESETLHHKTLTVQMVSNPMWYAVMALPYLMEYPHGCSEQVFNRLYANALARHIANTEPKIRRVFDQWKGTPALDSPLQKNQDLKAVILEETPWLRQAESERQARQNIGILFDANRLDNETARTLRRLSEMQYDDGAWPWFPGGRPNDFMTLYITTGFGRLRHMGVDIDIAPALKALPRIDQWIEQRYREILRLEHENQNNLSPLVAMYLYGRTFFLEDHPIADDHRDAAGYFLDQARTYWLDLPHLQSQAHLALALHRFDDTAAAAAIMRSIHERAVTDDDMGMFWRELEFSWWWYRAPIETQALMIEAFDEVMNDAETVEACGIWLLKQKQTQNWLTTKATADAVYALLLRGADRLASDELVEITLADTRIEPEDIEAGTGFYEKRFTGAEIQPAMGEITVRKIDDGIAWGSVHWQYLEDIDKITPHDATPLQLEKRLYTKAHTVRGPELQPVNGPLAVGDELVVRIVLRTDRDMEYVHLRDHRGSGTEPVNVLSRYRYQDGLRYYESTRDTASHFFIDYLPKGTYVFEYSLRIQHRGRYPMGTAHIQCMYAPEFNSHSKSLDIEVQ